MILPEQVYEALQDLMAPENRKSRRVARTKDTRPDTLAKIKAIKNRRKANRASRMARRRQRA